MDDHTTRVSGWLADAGYEVEESGEGFKAAHTELPTFLFRDLGSGTLFVIYFKAEGDPGELLVFVNELNRESASARFTIDGEGDFSMESWLPGTSDPETFRAFLGAWFEAWDLLVGSPGADRFLR